MADERGPWRVTDEPSTEDFEAAEEEASPVGVKAILFGVLRVAGVLLLILALLLYFIVPFRDVVIRVLHELQVPLQSIPLAPEPESNPKLPA